MIFSSQLSSTLLRTQKLHLPQTFRRYKSITAAIERGRQDGPDRPSRPRARAPPEDDGGERVKTRFEKRLERFGPSSERRDYTKDSGGRPDRDSRSSRGDRDGKPRSSRFGRIGPPGARGPAPSRFIEERISRSPRDRDEFSQRRDDSFGSSGGRTMSRGNRFDGENKPSSDRFERRDRPGFQIDDRKPRGERFERGDRPPRREGQFERGDRPPRREGQFEARGQRSFDRGNKSSDYQHTFFDRKPPQGEASEQDGTEGRTERPQRTERSFRRNDDSSSYTRERPGRDQAERYQSREFSRKPYETPTRAAGVADTQSSSDRGPESLPYSTAASEFIYGYSSVVAAMKANRRKLYSIYVHSRGASRDGLLARIRALKLFPLTQEVGDEYLRAMDKASSGRPHNGVILESSPLPVPPITELKSASIEDESFSVTVDSQSAEDALVNGKQDLYSYKAAGWRHPLILYVDGVLDEGNLGAIARSAYFLGIDAIVTPTRQIAPWSHIALKASAGAAEAIPIFKVGEPTEFLGKSARAGWRIYASDSVPPPASTTTDEPEDTSSNVVYTFARSTKRLPADHSPVSEHPTILMMGAEGAGLRDSLLNLAHYKVGIKHGREVDEVGVDSLNVSVAASLLCYEMLQKPMSKPAANPEEVLF